MTYKAIVVPIPRSKIPSLVPMCMRCGAMCRTIMSAPFADGYHRRHECKSSACRHRFYTLTPYGNVGPAQVSPLPFINRALTNYELDVREQWWVEEETVTMEVTLINRMAAAISKPEEERTEIEKFIVAAHDKINEQVLKYLATHKDTT